MVLERWKNPKPQRRTCSPLLRATTASRGIGGRREMAPVSTRNPTPVTIRHLCIGVPAGRVRAAARGGGGRAHTRHGGAAALRGARGPAHARRRDSAPGGQSPRAHGRRQVNTRRGTRLCNLADNHRHMLRIVAFGGRREVSALPPETPSVAIRKPFHRGMATSPPCEDRPHAVSTLLPE
jgi:hypothetical protein